MICKACKKTFKPVDNQHPHQKFCSEKCRRRYQRLKPLRELEEQEWFEEEWAAWKRDFAAGKTQSNGGRYERVD